MEVQIGKVFNRIPKQAANGAPGFLRKKLETISSIIKWAVLTPPYLALAAAKGGPGILLHIRLVLLGLRLLPRAGYIPQLFICPLDSVRYFEFDFVWKAIRNHGRPARILDLSSPRNILALLLGKYPSTYATLINPDSADLPVTKLLLQKAGYSDRCAFSGDLIQDAAIPAGHFDVITSISVIEHMPLGIDTLAVEKMWKGLKVGGILLITIPCAAKAQEEYLDYNEYNLLPDDQNGFSFSQRFYDENLLESQIFSVVGKPDESRIYGEVREGFFVENRMAKFTSRYPHWREAYMMVEAYKDFGSVSKLPGIGVIAMRFVKKAK